MSTDFVHLHLHTEYSLLDGANRVKEMMPYIKSLGMDSVAMTDHGAMYGAVNFYNAALKEGIKPIIGCEVYVAKNDRFGRSPGQDSAYYHLVLLAKDNEGYKNLIKLVSAGHLEGFYYKPRIDHEILSEHSSGLIALSACLSGEIPSALASNDYEEARKLALKLDGIFGRGNFYLELQKNGIELQNMVNAQLIRLARETGIPLVATNDAHYMKKSDSRAHEVLLCIQTAGKIDDEKHMRFESDELYIKSPEEMAEAFADLPEAIANTRTIADACNVTFDFDTFHLPDFKVEDGSDKFEYLTRLCEDGIGRLYGDPPPDGIRERLKYELNTIRDMHFVDYFLIVWDFIRYAKSRDIIVGPGRGSGAGSIAAYALGITAVDPIKYDLLFERFLNPERISMPDFDIDFCYERRQEVIDYVVSKYGAENTSQIITFGSMKARAVIRDVARALDIPLSETNRIAKMIPGGPKSSIEDAMDTNAELRALYNQDQKVKELIDYSKALEGLPRHASTHAAAVVITKEPVTEYLPVQRGENSILTQYDKDSVELLGLLKMDFLGLRTLTVIRDTVAMIKQNHGITIDTAKMTYDDPKVYKMLSDGHTSGSFQLESGGMTNFIKELQPDNLEDIIAGIALFRPGPMEQIPRYIRNKNDPSKITYLHPILEPILDVTYGCMVYQEQVMRIVREVAGYSYGRADLVRRAMSKKKYGVMQEERRKFVYGMTGEDGEVLIKGAIRNGVDEATANKIFDEMENFANYAFNKSHAAAYAFLAYQTAWFKYYYPTEFIAANINSFLDDKDKTAAYIAECGTLGIEVLPPDINSSTVKFNVKDKKVRFGLAAIKNTGQGAASAIVSNRLSGGPYKSFMDFIMRCDTSTVNKRCVESLIKCGAFDSMGVKRTQLLAVYEKMMDSSNGSKRRNIDGQASLFDMGGEGAALAEKEEYPELEEFPRKIMLDMEKEMLGLYVSGHPLDELRDVITSRTTHSTRDFAIKTATDDEEDESSLVQEQEETVPPEIRENMPVVIAGIIKEKQVKSTKTGSRMAFAKLEDYYGSIEVVFFPKTFERFGDLILNDSIVFVKGKLSLKDEAPKILCDEISAFKASQMQAQADKPAAGRTGHEALFLTFPAEMNNADCRAVLALLNFFKGETPVYARRGDNGSYTKLEPIYWAEPSDKLHAELTRRLGSKNILIKSDG